MLSRPMLSLSPFGRRLRVLAYHDVPNAESLRQQVEWLIEHFTPVTIEQALRIMVGDRESDRAVLLTFDDGDPSVIENALPVLTEMGVYAILFVCPGVIDSDLPFWWQVVENAIEGEVEMEGRAVDKAELGRLKKLPDPERRRRVAVIRDAVETSIGQPPRQKQLTTDELRRWVVPGHAIGNHTWDHPLLGTCEREEQIRQVDAAHEWLIENLGASNLLFAYPNGNHTSVTEARLRELGYQVGALFDHRLHRGENPLQMSRIRVNAADTLDEFQAKVSGMHPFVHRALGRS